MYVVIAALVAAASASALAATEVIKVAPEIEQAYKSKVSDRMKDPDSVQWRNVRFFNVEGGKANPVMCGEFNAKNSYGAYVGYQTVAVLGDAERSVITIPDFAEKFCAAAR